MSNEDMASRIQVYLKKIEKICPTSLSETDNQTHGEVTERTLQTDFKY